VLYDCYNSSPKALMAAVDTLAAMPARRRIVVAGEMLELGATGEQLHRECGRYIARNAAGSQAGKKIDFCSACGAWRGRWWKRLAKRV